MMDDSRIAFLTSDGLQRLRALRITVVGAGGSGSHIVQQLAHLGVGAIFCIDPDVLEASNVNRVVLSHYGAVGRDKARHLARRLRRLNTNVEPLVDAVESADAIAAIQKSDLVYGAVDHFGTRNLIEYFARMACVPVIDVGMQITPRSGGVVSAGGQIVTSIPGRACFRCLGFLTEDLLTRERMRYGAGDAIVEQQVISVNGILASQAVTNLLAIFLGFVGPGGIVQYLSYNALTQYMGPHPNLLGVDLDNCSHYPLEDAGWMSR